MNDFNNDDFNKTEMVESTQDTQPEYVYSFLDEQPNKNPKGGTKTKGNKVAVTALILSVVIFISAIAFVFINYNPTEVLPDLSGDTSLNLDKLASTNGDSSISDIVDKVASSVVEIYTEISTYNRFTGSQVGTGAGSGVVFSADGYIVTNYHVIEGSKKITVRTNDGTEYEAKLIGTDKANDLAVIKIEATGLNVAKIGDSDSIKVGELAIAIGNPLGTLGGTVSEGIISAKDRDITIDQTTMTLLQTTAAVNQGNSGGGLFNENGELIGIVNAKSSGSGIEGLGFAIPSNVVKEVYEEIIANGSIDKEDTNSSNNEQQTIPEDFYEYFGNNERAA